MKKIIILRGTSNAGKSSVANLFPEPKVICCADDFFIDNEGNYNFNAELLGVAHAKCKEKFDKALEDDTVEYVVVANTNTLPREFNYYINKAEEKGYMVFSLIIERRHNNKNNHNCPDEAIGRQAINIINNLKLI